MLISEVVAKLLAVQNEVGDVEVFPDGMGKDIKIYDIYWSRLIDNAYSLAETEAPVCVFEVVDA